MKFSLRLLYLYLFSFVGLLIVVIGGVRLVDLGIKTYIFPEADKYEIYSEPVALDGTVKQPMMDQKTLEERQNKEMARNRQRELSGSLSMIIVGVPLYLYHWMIIQKDKKKNES